MTLASQNDPFETPMDNEGPHVLDEFIDGSVQDQEKARRLLQRHPELIHARRGLGETALHFLAIENYVDAVRFLAECGADVNAKNEFGDTPLIDVATLGNAEVVIVLLEFGADPNTTSVTKDNALHCAVQSGNVRLVDILLSAGARGDYVTETGETIFDVLPSSSQLREEVIAVLNRRGVRRTT